MPGTVQGAPGTFRPPVEQREAIGSRWSREASTLLLLGSLQGWESGDFEMPVFSDRISVNMRSDAGMAVSVSLDVLLAMDQKIKGSATLQNTEKKNLPL